MADQNLEQAFDFAEHEKTSIASYLKMQPFYRDFASVVARIIEECLKKRGIKVHSIQNRPKEPESFGNKAIIPLEADPTKPKYPRPLEQITDLAGIRVITHFPGTLSEIDRLLQEEFEIVERSDKGEELIEEDRFGYQSIHYLLRIKKTRSILAEYERYANGLAEVQVRTILQHAWAEIEHDIQYKSSTTIPTQIHRRFMALAGMLEIADREFQAIQDADRELAAEARKMVNSGDLTGVEITPDALKLFLDGRLGADGRISDWEYDFSARLVKRLGFQDLKQVETAIANYDDRELSRIAAGGKQGQTTRFEFMLLAALGQQYLLRHPWSAQPWFQQVYARRSEDFKRYGIKLSTYDPLVTDENLTKNS
jgi:putative GTP pyrophosphokinase